MILLVQWRRRTKGSPRQIGQSFPLEGESQQKKKGLLDRIRGMNMGKRTGSQEHAYLERLRDLVKDKTDGDAKLMNGIITEGDAEYLEQRGLITVDPYTDNLSLTEAGQVYFLGHMVKEKKKVLKSLTEWEKDQILEQREEHGIESGGTGA